MAPGVYKSFRKAWDKNRNKFQYFVHNYGLDNFPNIDIFNNKIVWKVGEELSDSDIEDILANYYDNKNDKDRSKDMLIKMTIEDLEREVYQAMEAFVHNLNTLHARAGSQLPFSSINLGTDTSNAGRMVTKNLLLAMEAGLGHGETCIFPIVIFKVKEGVNYNPEDPNYDLLKLSYRVTGKRLFPNYLYLDSPFNLQYYKPGHPETECATMGE